ncbi:hypothetical protein Droror1_Dr00011106 [Drosera rotundifolia]
MPIEMPRGLPFSVDTWTPSSSSLKRHRFLTHAHKDHCAGIVTHASFPVYCTAVTRSIVMGYYPTLEEELFVGIEVGEEIVVDDGDGGFRVTAFDANHCPGALMFLFEGKFGNILHTGDCRLTLDCLQKLPQKYLGRKDKKPKCRFDYVFLDCTFGKIPLQMPSKHSALRQVINCIWRHPSAPVVYLTCDLLGQEEILVKVSQTFGGKIYVDKVENQECHQVLTLIAPEILSEDPSSRFQLLDGFPKLYERAQHKISDARAEKRPEPLIIRPSAQWYTCQEMDLTIAERRKIERSNEPVKDQFGVWHVCYSMHSSRQELEWALELLAPKWVVSTTPNCRAMELEYFKKHCFISRIEPDDTLWKLLNISVGRSSEANFKECILAEPCSSVADSLSEHCGQVELQLPLVSNHKRIQLSPPTNKTPITLFGRARLGLDFFSLPEEKAVISVTEDLVGLATKETEQKPTYSKGDSEFNNKSFTEVADEVHCKDNKEVDDRESPYKEEICVISRENKRDVDADQTKTNDLTDPKPEASTTVSKFHIESSRGYSDNLRKLYRSMNVPVPKPLPSLVELMQDYKRAKRITSISYSS